MNIGFVYLLLNPAFPRYVKIGRTSADPHTRAKQLSSDTGVPDDFIVIYHELVSDPKKVEEQLHDRFAEYRPRKNKEFFQIPMKDAIDTLQEAAVRFPVPSSASSIAADLMSHFVKHFGAYLDPNVTAIRLVQVPDTVYLEVTRRTKHGSPLISLEELPLRGLFTPNNPTSHDLSENEALVKSLDEYDWIMISDLFPTDVAQQIATEWEQPGGKLEKSRQT